MMIDAKTEKFEQCTVCGIPGVFTSLRVDRKTVPPELYAYDVRHGDDGWECEIEEFVFVNHFGTVITKKPLPLDEEGCLYLDEDTNCFNYQGGSISLEEFIAGA